MQRLPEAMPAKYGSVVSPDHPEHGEAVLARLAAELVSDLERFKLGPEPVTKEVAEEEDEA
jgi:hypothetical protein